MSGTSFLGGGRIGHSFEEEAIPDFEFGEH
jgi:hypothetical protein